MQEVQQRNYILRMLREQLEILEDQSSMLEGNLNGINVSLDTLKGLKENPEKKEQEVIVPLGPNAYTKAFLKDPNKILLYVKNDIVMEKSLGDAIESLEEMASNNEEVQEKLKKRTQEINQQIRQISSGNRRPNIPKNE